MLSVYVIGGPGGPYKVGHAASPPRRLRALQTASDRPLRLYFTSLALNAPEKERQVHSLLREHRLEGEWFSCSLDEIYDAFRDCGLDAPAIEAEPAAVVMAPDIFCRWVEEMRKRPFFADDAKCAELLGLSANSVVDMKKRGADRRTALACRALLHRLEPYA